MITLATMITLARILLAPVVIWYVARGDFTAATVFFMIAAGTDLVDGWVARRFNQQSRLGQLLDPVADKILIMATFVALLCTIALQPWHKLVVIMLVGKELILLLGAALLLWKKNIFMVPSRLSRAASLSECVAILAMLGSAALTGAVPSTLITIILLSNLCLSTWLLVRYGRMIRKI